MLIQDGKTKIFEVLSFFLLILFTVTDSADPNQTVNPIPPKKGTVQSWL